MDPNMSPQIAALIESVYLAGLARGLGGSSSMERVIAESLSLMQHEYTWGEQDLTKTALVNRKTIVDKHSRNPVAQNTEAINCTANSECIPSSPPVYPS
jgi:hypothetical protein